MALPSSPRDSISFLLLLVLVVGCSPSEKETEFLRRKALLERQNKGIRELIQDEEKGFLLPTDRFLIGVDEKVVQGLLNSQLPLERPLGKRLVLRLERATIQFRDKYGFVIVEGSVHRLKTPDRHTAVRVYGGLGAVEIDPQTNLLTIRFAIDDFQILQAGILEGVLGRGGKKFLATQALGYVKDALPALQVPVGLARAIRVPPIQSGAVTLDSLHVPLDLSVERVIAAKEKLWVTLHAEVGEIAGGEQGLGVAIKKKRKGGGR
jgi:hypothetical protein